MGLAYENGPIPAATNAGRFTSSTRRNSDPRDMKPNITPSSRIAAPLKNRATSTLPSGAS
ncbi:hypothetical protein WK39_09660 [Burkholderia cepacia]|nr:hypothetical protein WK03_26970 [Burkholderia cepacia]KVS58423.1 hypothetical protein WK40_25125 [Burkholderia cepacia]KVS63674.1 hypothetical protein WK39_09660 [Burkholderia cepacia]KVU48851.1 hypothetical protein WK70_36160 [Burkholderia cepacia]KVX60299.1 hypothetical protein WL06_05250 [Burkholderia cepacia]